jgi:hypothetical protein
MAAWLCGRCIGQPSNVMPDSKRVTRFGDTRCWVRLGSFWVRFFVVLLIPKGFSGSFWQLGHTLRGIARKLTMMNNDEYQAWSGKPSASTPRRDGLTLLFGVGVGPRHDLQIPKMSLSLGSFYIQIQY